MINVTGKQFLSITAQADLMYAVAYASGCTVDISNNTSGEIYVSDTDKFTKSDGIGGYITIARGGCYNGLKLDRDTIYIKAAGSGEVTLVSGRRS